MKQHDKQVNPLSPNMVSLITYTNSINLVI